MKKKVLLGLLLAFLFAQFLRIKTTVPEVDPKGTFATMDLIDAETLQLVKGACYDCHSYETKYPWYANVAPVSWWLKGHIDNGRDKLNFSLWNSYSTQRQVVKIEEIIETMEEQRMPLTTYVIMHKEGRIDAEESAQIITAFKNIQ